TFMPSADINTEGSIGFNFGESAKREFWSMYVAEKPAGGAIQGPVRVASGVARSPDSRVGDFSNTTVDPADGTTVWGANEYQGLDFWDTHLASWSIAGAVIQPAIATKLTAHAQAVDTQAATPVASASTIGSRDTKSQAVVSQAATEANAIRKAVAAADRFW